MNGFVFFAILPTECMPYTPSYEQVVPVSPASSVRYAPYAFL